MLFLRLYLLFGLVVHKVVWEVLKSPRHFAAAGSVSDSRIARDIQQSFTVQLVKTAKVAILIGIVAQTLLPDLLPISSQPSLLRIIGALIFTAGLAIAIRSRTELGTNWSDIEAATVSSQHSVISRGPYRYIRHPIYIGDLLLLFGFELALNSWLVLGVLLLTPVVLRQAVKEEEKLSRAIPEYNVYCSQTKRFIPFVV